ncbi:MAG: hypothetical protein ACQEXJ_01280 [Myxococcota bacterium]
MSATRSVLMLAVALLVGCAHAGRGKPTTLDELREDPKFLVHPDLAEEPEPVAKAWAAYAVGRLVGRHSLEEEATASLPYLEEWLARRALARSWKQQREAGEADAEPYLDALVEVLDAGFLEAYTVFFFASPGWTVPSAQRIELEGFLRWAREHLQPHEPKTLAAPRDDPDAEPPPVLGEDLAPSVVLAPDDEIECDHVVARTPTAVTRWDEQIVGVDAKVVGPPDRDELIATLLHLRREIDESQWVAWASPRATRLFMAAGLCAQDRGDFRVAQAYAETVVALRPTWSAARRELAHSLRMQGDAEEALREVARALRVADDPCERAAVLRQRGDVLVEDERLEEAREAYLASLRLQPAHRAVRRVVRMLDAELGGPETPLPEPSDPPCSE